MAAACCLRRACWRAASSQVRPSSVSPGYCFPASLSGYFIYFRKPVTVVVLLVVDLALCRSKAVGAGRGAVNARVRWVVLRALAPARVVWHVLTDLISSLSLRSPSM